MEIFHVVTVGCHVGYEGRRTCTVDIIMAVPDYGGLEYNYWLHYKSRDWNI